MEEVFERVCGLDVHKATIAACVRVPGVKSKRLQSVQTFGTTTADLLALRDWLDAHGVTHVAMESTGVYWKPVYYVLEDHVSCLLVNAAHVKQVPGRKTDVQDCAWLAQLLGLEAFSNLLKALPTDTGMAFVLVQHLDPKHESQLPDVLSRTTAMPVITVTNHLRAEPDHVYVIPSNADMTIGSGVFALTPRDVVDRHTPIDHFFRSLAQEREGRAIGVVLSGTGSDGTLGLRAIKAEGGMTFMQDEKSAKHPGMPQSALPIADFVLPPVGIARELVRIGGHPHVKQALPFAASPDQPERGADVGAVLRVLRAATGVDFAQYKPATVRRRIARRMLLQKIDDLGTYVRYLRQTPHEAQVLRDDILVQVTEFFRDPEGFEALRRNVFPSLVHERAADDPIRIWVPGCATGEEAYSLVISLLEFLGEVESNLAIQMFATDLSAAAIARARAGTFSPPASRTRSRPTGCDGSSSKRTGGIGSARRFGTSASSRRRT